MYETAFGRPPVDAEMAEALTFLKEQGASSGHADETATWRELCHVLMNVKEFIFVP